MGVLKIQITIFDLSERFSFLNRKVNFKNVTYEQN